MEDPKQAAAERAVAEYVESGMVVGLGTGSTASWAVRRIGGLLTRGELAGVRGVPTSRVTAALAREVGVPLVDLAEATPEVVIDGADEIDPGLNLVKGLGGALLREKIVAHAAGGLVAVADGSKLVPRIGRGPVPVEVEPFGWRSSRDALASLGCDPALRMREGEPFLTDGGHYILDCRFGQIKDAAMVEAEIRAIPGAIESGLFVGLCRAAVVAREDRTEVIANEP